MEEKKENICKTIPHSLYIAVWNKKFGVKSGKEKCPECKKNNIYQLDFECKFINGKNINIDNLTPVCKECLNIKKRKSREIETPLINPSSPQTEKTRKDFISQQLRMDVWKKYIGLNIGETKCLCCGIIKIQQLNFECGHIIAESLGGPTNMDNLLPICGSCNKSMGTKNLYEFKKLLMTQKIKCCCFFW